MKENESLVVGYTVNLVTIRRSIIDVDQSQRTIVVNVDVLTRVGILQGIPETIPKEDDAHLFSITELVAVN